MQTALSRPIRNWYTSDSIQYDPETSGFRYNFAVENGSYEVTVGIKIPGWWGARTVDIDLEGTRTTDQASVPGGSATNATFERTSEIMVTDGELNVFVHNSKRTSADGDPILSYILVKRGEVYDKATLTDKIAEIEGKVGADQAGRRLSMQKSPLASSMWAKKIRRTTSRP